MIRPKSLQQRLSLFMILPVALLLVGMGIASFILCPNGCKSSDYRRYA
jgi:capsular polysaccharide biosynthesis protein